MRWRVPKGERDVTDAFDWYRLAVVKGDGYAIAEMQQGRGAGGRTDAG